MGPSRWGALSAVARGTGRGSRCTAPASRRATAYSTSSTGSPDDSVPASGAAAPSSPPSEIGTFLTNYTCSVTADRRLVSMAGAPMPGTGATSAGEHSPVEDRPPDAQCGHPYRGTFSTRVNDAGGLHLPPVQPGGPERARPGRRGPLGVCPRWGSRRPPPDAEHEEVYLVRNVYYLLGSKEETRSEGNIFAQSRMRLRFSRTDCGRVWIALFACSTSPRAARTRAP